MNTTENNKLIAEFMEHPVMVWNDPDPIEGNDYRVVYFKKLCDKTALIQYGVGKYNSEAEVFISELEDVSLQYNTSWDWLMPVVEKIKQYCLYKVEDVGGDYKVVFIDNSGYNPSEQKMFMYSHEDYKKATYKAVVEFIKWYNENKGD